MFCKYCGKQVEDGQAFCPSCGERVDAAIPAAAPVKASGEGCLKAAWRDITSTKKWFKKMLLLCILGVIPILNFGVQGYAIRWASELSEGNRNPMPKQIFRKKEISTGFFGTVVGLGILFSAGVIVTLLMCIVGGIFGLFSSTACLVVCGIIGIVAAIFMIIVAIPCEFIAVLRMSTKGYLEAGFNYGLIWKSFKKAKGSAIAAAFVPTIIISIIAAIFVGIISAAIAATLYSGYSSSLTYSYGYGYSYSYAYPTFGAFSGVILLAILLMIIVLVLSTFAQILSYRAFGHWVARNAAADWASEDDESAAAGVVFADDNMDAVSPFDKSADVEQAESQQAVEAQQVAQDQAEAPKETAPSQNA